MIISSMFLDVFLRIAKDELLVIWWDLVVWIFFFLNPMIPPKSPVHHISWPVIVLLVEWVECTVSIASTPAGREPRGGGLRLARIRHTDLFHHLASLSTALADERWALLSLSLSIGFWWTNHPKLGCEVVADPSNAARCEAPGECTSSEHNICRDRIRCSWGREMGWK